MPQTYLFDLDGTLIDTTIYERCYQPIIQMIKQKRKLSLSEINKRAKALGLSKNEFDRWDTGDLCHAFDLLDDYYTILKQEVKGRSLLQEKVVQKLKTVHHQRQTVGIVSNSMRKTITLYLTTYKLLKYVNFVYSSEDAGCRKDTMAFWKKLVNRHNLDPKRCTVIGNNPLEDGTVPQKVGFKTILVSNLTTKRT
ncbi:MAG: HAD family hydrolase [Nanoarchaeota archaeon]